MQIHLSVEGIMIIMIITNTMVRFIHIIIRQRIMFLGGGIPIVLILYTAITMLIVLVVFAIKSDSCISETSRLAVHSFFSLDFKGVIQCLVQKKMNHKKTIYPDVCLVRNPRSRFPIKSRGQLFAIVSGRPREILRTTTLRP